MKFHFKLLVLFAMCCFWQASIAQTPSSFFDIDERRIIETKWKYAYALHLESNTIIHQAENTYEYFLYFRYNYTYEQYLNGKFSKGTWRLVEDNLFYRFKHIKQFTIAAVSKQVLILEFTQDNSRGTYQYHFVSVSSEQAPFIKPTNELPLVKVEVDNPQEAKKRWWAFAKRKKKRRKEKAKAPKETLTYISIELTGGGFYGGINPVYKDYIHIKNDGRLIRELQNEQNGLVVTKRTIARAELETFAQSIIDRGFFEMERMYDCETALCSKRKQMKPTPIPLRIAIAYGDRRKVITISMFGKDERHMQYVEYPEVLNQIIAGIQNFVHRLEAS